VNRIRPDLEIRPVARALDILTTFDYDHQELGITQLAQKLSLSKNNVFRLLATLETRGYVAQDKKKRTYRLGLKTFEVGNVFLQQLGIRQRARPVLEDLIRRCDETAYLAVLDGPEVVFISMYETSHALQVAPRLGRRLPAYCTAAGKCQLAFESRDKLDEMFRDRLPGSRTDKTNARYEDFLTHLKEIARTGYATEDEEWEPGVRSVATPIRDYAHRVVAAVAVSGPTSRIPPERIDAELIHLAQEAAATISHRLGYEIARGGSGVRSPGPRPHPYHSSIQGVTGEGGLLLRDRSVIS